MKSLDRDEVRRLLVRLPNWMGDTVMALPALRTIRNAWSGGTITLVGPWAQLVSGQDVGDEFVDAPHSLRDRARFIREIRSKPFDLAILLPNSFHSALLAWLGRVRWRVGYRGDARDFMLTHPVPPASESTHQVDQYLGLLEAIGISADERVPRFRVTEEARSSAQALMRSAGVEPERRPIGIQLGAAFGPSKRWIPERIVELVDRLHDDGLEVLLLGGREEEPLARWIADRARVRIPSLVGKDSPDLLPGLLFSCRALLSADSGPAHLAAAVGTPVVTIFGPTDPRKTRPLGEHQTALSAKVACSPCFLPHCPIDHICMTGISVGEVLDGLIRAAKAVGI